MDQLHAKKLLLSDYDALLQLLTERGINYEPTYSVSELAKLSIPDLKTLVQHLRDLSRTPPSAR
jgi:hypothetical protein